MTLAAPRTANLTAPRPLRGNARNVAQRSAPGRQPRPRVAFPSPGGLRQRSASLKTGSHILGKARSCQEAATEHQRVSAVTVTRLTPWCSVAPTLHALPLPLGAVHCRLRAEDAAGARSGWRAGRFPRMSCRAPLSRGACGCRQVLPERYSVRRRAMRWAEMINRVYAADPLLCPKCS